MPIDRMLARYGPPRSAGPNVPEGALVLCGNQIPFTSSASALGLSEAIVNIGHSDCHRNLAPLGKAMAYSIDMALK
jgi:hypothetical protein